MAVQSGLSRQRRMKHQRSEATGSCLCITIRFVLLLTTAFHYDMLCSNNYQTCLYIGLICKFLQ